MDPVGRIADRAQMGVPMRDLASWLIVLCFLVSVSGDGRQAALATYLGKDTCNACKYCGHCAKQGGTCGVCKRA